MKTKLLKQWRTSVALTGLLAGVLTISACQQKQDADPSLEDDINAEQSVPMSAEPAEPNDVVVDTQDPSLNEVEGDTVASVNMPVDQINYSCTPELAVEATYKDAENQVIIATAKGTTTLTKTNDATNPEVFEVANAIEGGKGFVQWRVAHQDRQTGVMRIAGTDSENVSTYECKKTEESAT